MFLIVLLGPRQPYSVSVTSILASNNRHQSDDEHSIWAVHNATNSSCTCNVCCLSAPDSSDGWALCCHAPPLFSLLLGLRCRPSERAPNDLTQDKIPIQTAQSFSSLFIFLDYHQICVTSKAALLTRSDALPLLSLLLVDTLTFSYVSLLMPANCADRRTWELNR